MGHVGRIVNPPWSEQLSDLRTNGKATLRLSRLPLSCVRAVHELNASREFAAGDLVMPFRLPRERDGQRVARQKCHRWREGKRQLTLFHAGCGIDGLLSDGDLRRCSRVHAAQQ